MVVGCSPSGMQQLGFSKRVPMSMKPAALALAGLLWCCTGSALAAPGDLDTSFGRHGLVHSNLGGIDYATGVGLQDDGRIVVAGYADLDPPPDARMEPGKLDFAVARYTARGRLDLSFAGRGYTTLGLGGQENASALEVNPFGILVGGQSRLPGSPFTYGLFALARFGPDGQPDPTFGDDGWVTIPQTAGSWASVALVHRLQSGELVAVGSIDPSDDTHTKLVFVHLYDDGSPNRNFTPTGVKIVDFNGNDGWPNAYLRDSRGGLLVAGIAAADFDGVHPVFVQRFSLDGVPDLSFGTNGVVRVGSTPGSAGPMALQHGGSVIASFAGDRYGEGRLVRISPTGTLDGTFGKGGGVDTIGPSSLAVDRADRIVVAGSNLQIERYGRNGGRDRGFKKVSIPRAYRTGPGTDVAIAPDGDLVAAGWWSAPSDSDDFSPTKYDFAVARFHGGDDASPPVVGFPKRPKGCLRDALHLRVRVRDASGSVRVVARLDGRLVLRTRRLHSLVRVPAGRHRLVVRARDSSDNVAVKTLRFRACR
jgi:uncharacterized delta-60 repeat protein